MVADEKIIKQGIQLTEAFFKKFKNQILHDLSICKTYEEFLERTQDYTTNNILVNSGYSAQMESLIILALNDSKLMRASQRKLVEETIRNNVAYQITNVGETIKETIRDIVRDGYDQGLHSKDMAKNINKEIDKINTTRARTIARTEVKRTRSIANYVKYKEMGATGFIVNCRPDCCPICAEDYAGVTNPDFKSNYQIIQNLNNQLKRNPRRKDAKDIKDKISELNQSQDNITGSNDGHLIGGNIEFTMDQTDMLPPRHPNCRCSATFIR